MVALDCLAYGIGSGAEGVCLRLQLGPYRILLDCGLSSLEPLITPDNPADLVLCSHAHADHAQGLLPLHQRFPQLPIYASEVTTHLLPLNWPDVAPVPEFCRALPWRSPVEFGEGLTAELFPAGHLPGAAAFLLTYTPNDSDQAPCSVFYSGDFFISHARLVNGLPLEAVRGLAPDVLIVEGSLGTARYPHRRQQENQLAELIYQALQGGQNVILPVPPLGMAQELLLLLRSHHLFTGKAIDIWVDRDIAQACDAYLAILPHLPTSVQNFAQHQALFWDTRIRPHVQHLHEAPLGAINTLPSIVFGDWQTDFTELLATPGRPWLMLLPQATPAHPDPLGAAETQYQPLIARNQLELLEFSLSFHADGPATTQLIHNLRPQHVVLIHGRSDDLADLAGLEELSNRYHIHTPQIGSQTDFPLGEFPLQANPALTHVIYEGEVTEWGDRVVISLPLELTTDKQWQNLGDTGLVSATWQGDSLVLRGLTQRELLRPFPESVSQEQAACSNCQAYRQQRCWHEQSPLYSFKVAPEGYCPAFIRREI